MIQKILSIKRVGRFASKHYKDLLFGSLSTGQTTNGSQESDARGVQHGLGRDSGQGATDGIRRQDKRTLSVNVAREAPADDTG